MVALSARLMIVAAAAALTPVIAGAQMESSQVVATAHAGQAVAQAAPDAQVSQLPAASAIDDAQGQDAPGERRVHGEISVGVGTGGYREVDGAATAPIGDSGEASVAIGAGQIGTRR